VDVYVMAMGDVLASTMALSEQLRDALPGRAIQLHCGGGSFKSQMKKADRSGAAVALIIGEDELASNSVMVKPLRGQAEQQQVSRDQVASELVALLADN
jgi:histidyl-tRNA synthetase